jgi:hypothetical protein
MTFTLTLLVLLAPGDEGMAGALAAATRATLGESTTIELRIMPPPEDDGAIALGQQAHARGVAVISWADADKQHARIRLYSQATGRVVEREIAFAPGDALEEKGRTLGFALASMLPESEEPVASAAPAASAPAPPAAPAPAPAPPAAPAPAPPPALPAPPPPWTFSIDAAAQMPLALGGEGTGLGGALGGQYRMSDHLALRAGAALRFGHLEALEAHVTTVDLGPGLVWRSNDPEPRPRQRFALALRFDGLARLNAVRRPAHGMVAAESQARFVPAVGMGIEGMIALTRVLGLFADAGADVTLGETEVVVRGRQVAAFAPVGLAFELGARARF